ncbi:MAG: hypothetical protein HYZ25_19085 [Chloroflexi bacterium]|nr:hypothetical protein [Chloroflexota bacterium]
MKTRLRTLSPILLLIGIILLAIGMYTNNTAYSWASAVLILLSLFTGGRWMRPRKK